MFSRRHFIQHSVTAGVWLWATAGNLLSGVAQAAWPIEKFTRTDFDSALLTVTDGQTPIPSDQIAIDIPETAENGAIVPIKIRSHLAATRSISIFAEKNPVPHIARFNFSPSMSKQVTARIKLAESCDVIALVRADEQFYSAKRSVRVTIGGCGG